MLTASSLLADYQDWPYLAQVVKIERTRTTKVKEAYEMAYGITSLPTSKCECGA